MMRSHVVSMRETKLKGTIHAKLQSKRRNNYKKKNEEDTARKNAT